MPIPVNSIFTRAALVLNDVEFVRWTQAELIDWLNDCAASIINRRPAAFAQIVNFMMAAGTKQQLAPEMVQLLDVVRNIKADSSPGRPIGMVDRKLLDDTDPDWHSAKPSSNIGNYTHDLRSPRTFYVYPPASAGQLIEILAAVLPATVTSVDDQFGIGAEFIEAIVHYLCYRALSKDSEYGQGQMAAAYFSAFQDSLGTQGQTAQAAAPESASV